MPRRRPTRPAAAIAEELRARVAELDAELARIVAERDLASTVADRLDGRPLDGEAVKRTYAARQQRRRRTAA